MDFEISFDFIVFETERLLLREFNADDVDAVYAYAGDAENTIYMDWGPASREEVRNFVQSRLAQQITEPRRIFDFAVCIKATGRLIGSMGLFLGDDGQQAELGYTINKAFWGKGYASEAAKGMLQFGFMNLNLHRISAKVRQHEHCLGTSYAASRNAIRGRSEVRRICQSTRAAAVAQRKALCNAAKRVPESNDRRGRGLTRP